MSDLSNNNAPFDRLRRPLDRLLYAPIREQNRRQEEQRINELQRRREVEKARVPTRSKITR